MKKFRLFLMLAYVCLTLFLSAQPCTPTPGYCPVLDSVCAYKPVAYYTFDNDCNRELDCINGISGSAVNPGNFSYGYQPGNVGQAFSPLFVTSGTEYFFPAKYPSGSYNGDYSVEFAFKLRRNIMFLMFGGPTSSSGDFALPYFWISPDYLWTIVRSSSGNKEVFKLLNGSGLFSSSYYYDSNWHHAAMKYDSNTGKFELFIDGQSPPEFKITLGSGESLIKADSSSVFRFTVNDSATLHDLDELVFYDKALPDNVIWQHYQSFFNHMHYNNCDTTIKVKFKDCGATALDIKNACLQSTDTGSVNYAHHRYEFCTDSTFSSGLLTYDDPAGCVTVHAALPFMLYDTKYYARLRVKTPDMSVWSVPGPVCTFTTGACTPESGYCPVFDSVCAYKPIMYFTFDNDCTPQLDCINGISGTPHNSDLFVYGSEPSSVGRSFSPVTHNGIGTGYRFPTGYKSGSYNGDYSVEFGFKLGYDGSFLMYSSSPSAPGSVLPYFLLTSNYLWVIVRETGVNLEIFKYLSGNDLLSPSYYYDYKWHHAAMKYDSGLKRFELFIDGKSPSDFKISLTSGQTLVKPDSNTVYNLTIDKTIPTHIDELAFYDKALPDNVIWQHYQSFINHNHYAACNIDTSVTAPSYTPTPGALDSLSYVPGYGTYVLNPGKQDTYYSCDLGAAIPSTAGQVETYPLPRYKPGHTLNKNINWSDTKYLGGQYSGSCGSLNWSRDPDNDARIQTELAKNWNYMFNLSFYSYDTENSVLTTAINANPEFKVSFVGNIYYINSIYEDNHSITSDIRTNDIDSVAPVSFSVSPSCNDTLIVFEDPRYTANYKRLGRVYFKLLADKYLLGAQQPNSTLVPLTKKIDFVSDNSWESGFYAGSRARYSCFFSNIPALDYDRSILSVPYNPVVPNNNSPDWDDYFGYVVGNKYKAYADAMTKDNTTIYSGLNSSDLFESDSKFLFYQISSVKGMASIFDNYNTKRYANSMYTMSDGTADFTNYHSTPGIYPTGPIGWYRSFGPFWGIDQLGYRTSYEIPIGDRMFAPFVSAGGDRDANCLRPGQYLGLLKAMGMFGADFFHAGYFNVTPWITKQQPGDMIGFANDARTWVWQLATASYAQGISSRYEYIIKNCDMYAVRKFGNEYCVINKAKSENKYLVFGTIQTMSNLSGNSPLTTTVIIPEMNNVINGFKIDVRRQGSTYILDMTNSPPVFYQLDKWHEYTHPGYWSKDFDFEAEVDDSGNSLDLVTELPAGAAPGDYTSFTTSVRLTPSGNNVKYVFTPRDATTTNNDYQLWLRMKYTGHTKGKAEIKLNNANTFIVDSIKGGWQWYAYETCGCTAMTLDNLSAADNTLTIISNDTLMIDRVVLKKDFSLTWQTPANCSANSCTFTNNLKTSTAIQKNNAVAKKQDTLRSIDLIIKPNPASNGCVISSESVTPDKQFIISLINMLGVEVKTMHVSNANRFIQVTTSDLPNGMYTLIITDLSSSLKGNKKIIVQRD